MYTISTFNNPTAFQDFLNGVVLGKGLPELTYGLDGLTLIVTTSAGQQTVTFDDADLTGLTPSQILAQIRDQDASLTAVVLRNYGYNLKSSQLAVVEEAAIVSKDGTANTILGFSAAADATVAPIDKGDIVTVSIQLVNGPQYLVIVES